MSRFTDEHHQLGQCIQIIQAIRADLDSSPLTDMVLKCPGKWPKSAILDTSTHILPFLEQERLLCGHVVVLGKVTRVLEPSDEINLYRRSLFGCLTPDQRAKLSEQFTDKSILDINLHAHNLEYPALEVIPMAIFVYCW